LSKQSSTAALHFNRSATDFKIDIEIKILNHKQRPRISITPNKMHTILKRTIQVMIARDIMITDFQTLRPKNTLAEAVNCFYKASAALRRKVFGLMVTDEN
jgi:hypothetical protein